MEKFLGQGHNKKLGKASILPPKQENAPHAYPGRGIYVAAK